MGTVYDGFDPLIARQVAIKTVRLPEPDDLDAQDELARFKREAQAAGRLSHPNIVGVFDYGETPDIAYIVMEYVDGTTLKHLTDKKDRFELPEIVRLMTELMAGLQYSHDRGVVHRDIKPANIMLTKKGEVKIADFGIARIESSSMTQAGTMLGTPSYMSPEQFMGQTVDARTDLYSSGVLLYQLLTGEKPFEGGLTAIMHKVLNTEPPPPSALSVTVPAAFDAVVKKAMAKRPEDRYASAKDFAEAVRAAIDAKPLPILHDTGFSIGDFGDGDATLVAPSHPAPAAPPPKPAVAKKGAPVALIGGIVAVLVILGGGAAYVMLAGKPKPAPIVQTPVATTTLPPIIKPATPAVPPPANPPPTNAQVMATLNATLASLPCTLLSGNATLISGAGNITLAGIAGAGAPQAALTAAEKSLPAQVTLTDQVQTIDGPYCDALNALRPYRPLMSDTELKLDVTGGNRALHNNETISIDASLPAGATYIETDYFQGDGTVYHPPNPKLQTGQTAVSEQIGAVSAPYGTDLMIAITSSIPLFEKPRGQIESDTDYLPALRRALQNAVSTGAKISVAAIPVVTVP